ncbi:vesicular glutamate transporter 1-like [Homalodisca vitripennis]|uniref:vesicular glutamate transporter 1-like n=1 Tax=Homalodisca vitripennis TaxID=197043 RepID=UPI001EEA973E|nr:vesicular glutamate transporter 1-like [Homalodisca vitripennis]XP_046658357.1 vesicular glutamate transporter 1-like [Homalodisca vitripennis]XP_046658358.1 vesicular glutamate transporter 1-like [Homalodisca vitripennis]XP_046658359.1 vesicular glutamate transporter 1-like [Homalodisca vitripennis]
MLRVNLNVGIVAMNAPYKVTLSNGTVVEKQDFNWNSKMQGVALSSFFYGYSCTQLLAGWLATRFGGKIVFGLGVFVTALMTMVTPLAANTSFYLLVAVRIIEGVFEGGTYPCAQAIYAQWAPPQERSRITGVTFMGISVGLVVGLQLSGIIGSLFGWSPIFYITGVAGLAWSAVWFYVAKNSPEEDPHISAEELKFIKDSLGDSHNNLKETIKIKHPWGKILTCVPLWALILSNFCINWGHYTILTLLPMFMKDIFDYQLANAGFITSVPYIVMAITMQFAGNLADWLVNKNIFSATMVRKVLISGAFFIQAVCLVLVGHLTSVFGVLLCLMIDVGTESFSMTSSFVNCLELAPQHASVMFGLSNTVGTLAGSISPLVSGFIITDHSQEQWRIVFYIASAVLLAGALIYGVFASGEKQPWAMEEKIAENNFSSQKHSHDNKAYVEEHQ